MSNGDRKIKEHIICGIIMIFLLGAHFLRSSLRMNQTQHLDLRWNFRLSRLFPTVPSGTLYALVSCSVTFCDRKKKPSQWLLDIFSKWKSFLNLKIVNQIKAIIKKTERERLEISPTSPTALSLVPGFQKARGKHLSNE